MLIFECPVCKQRYNDLQIRLAKYKSICPRCGKCSIELFNIVDIVSSETEEK